MTDEKKPPQPGVCPDCGAPLDFLFKRPFKDIAYMIYEGNEWVSLEPFPVELYCTEVCGYRRETTGREFTIDIEKGVITFGRIDKPE